jgi:hypothetical protein
MLVIEEVSSSFRSSRGPGDDARMVGVYEEVIRLGRSYGIGWTMILSAHRA